MVDSVVTVKQGKIKGSVQKLLDGSPYLSFKGIPYAQPPVGDLRFRAPLPPTPWSGIREATDHGPICSQYDFSTNQILNGSEDCLFLNVYSKSLKANAKIPVMVYIYGGGFMSGSGNQGSYGPEFLLQHNVVVVSMNYRLEVLGFLSLDTPEVPGNAGMKDQVLALRWVKENIAKFGGDPDNVTIFGESAGSVAVTYHMISPMSNGLFHKAIAQSGVCIDDSGIATGAKERAFRVAKLLGKETTDVQELLRFLRSVPATKLANMTFVTETADEKLRGVPMRFGPVVENKFMNTEAFISEDPANAVLSKKVNKVPLIIGYNSAEGLIMLADQMTKAERLNANSSYLVPRELVQKVSFDKMKDLGKQIMNFYTGDKGMGNHDTAQGVVNMRTDMHFAYNIHRFTHLYSSLEAPVYMYRFDCATQLNVVKNFIGLSHMPGACHADDLFYFFFNELNKEIVTSQESLRRIVY
ncbi:Uncharacterized protein OBRU01_13925 [Operophtera brumata]|uniref:Carboxylic ester hydrolase n=1 Tax=Operophtera brumata TaxID=104452 RepID=A0A0L7L7S2_OPEBR|nr:Uncharacterized protein OBRU01_13925 [Operophtera brumata]